MTGFWIGDLLSPTRNSSLLPMQYKSPKEDPKKLRKKIKRISRYYKSTLGELARLDDSIYNVMEQPQGDADGDKGPEVEGDESSNRESDRTEP